MYVRAGGGRDGPGGVGGGIHKLGCVSTGWVLNNHGESVLLFLQRKRGAYHISAPKGKFLPPPRGRTIRPIQPLSKYAISI